MDLQPEVPVDASTGTDKARSARIAKAHCLIRSAISTVLGWPGALGVKRAPKPTARVRNMKAKATWNQATSPVIKKNGHSRHARSFAGAKEE